MGKFYARAAAKGISDFVLKILEAMIECHYFPKFDNSVSLFTQFLGQQ